MAFVPGDARKANVIPAKKNRAFDLLAYRWVSRALRRRFHGVYLAGGEHLHGLPIGTAVIGCVNHTNWWDGFVLHALSHRRLPHEIYLAMAEENLRRYRFFTWMGVFGVDLRPGARNVNALRYAIGLLTPCRVNRPALIWMFVQGKLVPERRPVEVLPGAAFLARRGGAMLLPVSLRYPWLSESRPSVFIRVGAPMPADTGSPEIADTLNGLLARTDQSLERPDLADYEPLFEPGMSLNRRWDYVRHILGGRRESFDKSNH